MNKSQRISQSMGMCPIDQNPVFVKRELAAIASLPFSQASVWLGTADDLQRMPFRLLARETGATLHRVRRAANAGRLRFVLVGRRRIRMTTRRWVTEWLSAPTQATQR